MESNNNYIRPSETSIKKANETQRSIWQILYRNLGSIAWWRLTFQIVRSRLWLNPPVPWVALVGLDGSGKSSTLEQLEVLCSPPLFTGVKITHRRPGLIIPLKTGNHEPGAVIDHYAEPSHNVFKSVVKLGAVGLDWLAGYWGRIVYQQARGYLVVFDRYYWLDLLVDPRRYRYGAPSWIAHLARQLLPKPDLTILLDAPVEVLQNRKQEVSSTEAFRQRSVYLKLVQDLPNSYIVDASKPLDQVVMEVFGIILDQMATRRDTMIDQE